WVVRTSAHLQVRVGGPARRDLAGPQRRAVAARLDVAAPRAPVVRVLGIHLGAAGGTGELERHTPILPRVSPTFTPARRRTRPVRGCCQDHGYGASLGGGARRRGPGGGGGVRAVGGSGGAGGARADLLG